jgi:hypothetical protein
MIKNNIDTTDVLHICFIKDGLDNVQAEFGSLISNTLNKKWKQKDCILTQNIFKDFFAFNNYQEQVKCLIWNPKPLSEDITAFLTNMPDGWPTLINQYLLSCKHEIIRVVISGRVSRYPVYIYEQVSESTRRVIQVQKDGEKWSFFQSGALLPFEKEEHYKKRRIAERLNADIIKDYLRHNSIDIESQDFWESNKKAVGFFTDLSFSDE